MAENTSEVRYDRQLRLWGGHGQAALSAASVCLIGATAAGTEALKSLVLPGVGSVTIVDDALVTEEDLGVNFFVGPEHLGRPRAKAAAEFLGELNPAVDVTWRKMSLGASIEGETGYLTAFSIVIVAGARDTLCTALANALRAKHIPLLVLSSVGMVACLRVVASDPWAVETHPDNPPPDLRLANPFPELKAFVDAIDLDAMNHQQHSHVPFVVLLFKALDKWRESKNLALDGFPANYAEKKEVKAILEGMRMADDHGRLDEENFAEALAAANRALVKAEVPPCVAAVVQTAASRLKLNAGGPWRVQGNFWPLCSALESFVGERGCLPLTGALPDMFSDSESYLSLLGIYHAKAKADAAVILEKAREQLELRGSTSVVSEEEAARFARNAANIWAPRDFGAVVGELGPAQAPALKAALVSDPTHAVWFLSLLAAEKFRSEKNRYPGTNGIPVELDRADLARRVQGFGAALGLVAEVEAASSDAALAEMCRYGGAELHAVSAWLGGVAAQEAVKLLTHQYVPVQSTLVFDAFTQTAATLHL